MVSRGCRTRGRVRSPRRRYPARRPHDRTIASRRPLSTSFSTRNLQRLAEGPPSGGLFMNVTRLTCAAIVAASLALAPSSALAQDPKPQPPAEQPPAPEPPPQAPPTLGSAVSNSKVFNPDIAVIGDFLGAAGTNDVNPVPALEMHESEVAFQAVVDPYARADFFISFGQEGVNLEEGFITLTELPGGLLTKVGKMRAAFGKVNSLHNHILSWTDRPLVTSDLVGGEDGIDDTGFSVSKIFAGPKDIFLEGTAQLFRGDSDNLYRSYRRSDVSTVEHLRAYRDISESVNLDLGGSYSRGHSAIGPNVVNQLFGVDATVRW